jgi:hypothetical protein
MGVSSLGSAQVVMIDHHLSAAAAAALQQHAISRDL